MGNLDAWSHLVVIHSCKELIFNFAGIMKIQTVHSTPSNWQFIAISFPHEPFKDNNIITIVLLMYNIKGGKKRRKDMTPCKVVHICQTTWCHISFSHYKKNFKSHINKLFCYRIKCHTSRKKFFI
jgi:myosin-crossreactive antigen